MTPNINIFTFIIKIINRCTLGHLPDGENLNCVICHYTSDYELCVDLIGASIIISRTETGVFYI